MSLIIGGKTINEMYAGEKQVIEMYIGDRLIYGGNHIEIDPTYNYFVFDTSLIEGVATVKLYKNRSGDTTSWDRLTDWGDGTVDTLITHTYSEDGKYTVKTKYALNNGDRVTGNINTEKMLIKCLGVNNNITQMKFFFTDCVSLTTINLSNFDASNVTNMKGTFNACTSLTSLNLSHFNTSKVTDMSSIFNNCYSLVSINLSNWNTSNVTNMSYMFSSCYNIAYLNISNFDMNNVTNTTNMFYCNSELTIDNIIMTNCSESTKNKITELLNNK